MSSNNKSFYCLYKKCSEHRYQIILFAHSRGVISLDFLFEKATAIDLEHIFSPQGASWEDIEFFISDFLKQKKSSHVYLLGLSSYNMEVLKISEASLVYSIFERSGRCYPDKESAKSLRERFLKL